MIIPQKLFKTGVMEKSKEMLQKEADDKAALEKNPKR
jgi:hypothetical protein